MIHTYDFNTEEFLPKIKIPSFIIHGSKDSVLSVNSSIEMNKNIKNSKLVIFDGSNHIVILNEVEKVSKEIDKFVSSFK